MQNFDRSTLELLEPLSRLIPEKPVFSDFHARVVSVFRCPCCHSWVLNSHAFCVDCGQALNWDIPDENKVLPVVLCVPRDQVDEVRLYCSQGGEMPSSVDLSAIAAALECALSREEVPGND